MGVFDFIKDTGSKILKGSREEKFEAAREAASTAKAKAREQSDGGLAARAKQAAERAKEAAVEARERAAEQAEEAKEKAAELKEGRGREARCCPRSIPRASCRGEEGRRA